MLNHQLPGPDDGQEAVEDRGQKDDQLSPNRLGSVSWDRVISAFGKRMTPGDSRRAHPPAAQPAIPLNRLIHVVGTGRVVTAGRRKDLRERRLVTPNQSEEQPGHELSFESLIAACSASATSSAKSTTSAAG